MNQERALDRWLSRLVRVSLVALVALMCFFMWRISMIALRIERAITSSAEKVEAVSRSAAEIGQQVAQVGQGIDALTDKVAGMSEWFAVRERLGNALLPGETTAQPDAAPDPAVETEVDYLLTRIRESGLQFQHDDDTVSAEWTAMKFGGVYRIFRGSLPSAETFIERVASQQLDGDAYMVVQQDGTTRPLKEWLLEALNEYRQSPQPPSAPQTAPAEGK